jgi:uncharacterized zinc-type alcohol dehydrogenase-like protein
MCDALTNDYPKWAPSDAAAAPVDMICLACDDQTATFNVIRAKRRPLGEYDVQIDVKFCGICHSDVHLTCNHNKRSLYPMCPGHEIAGVAVAVGSKVRRFKPGDHVGVGCFVDACLECEYCRRGDEQYCARLNTQTYGAPDKHGRAPVGDPQRCKWTSGGYSSAMVVHERFALRIPAGYPLAAAGPLMCAGITMYDPMVHWKVGPGTRVGVAGLGGLGSLGVKIAKALGATVTAVSRSAAKRGYAAALGADHFVAMDTRVDTKRAARSLDLLIDTVAAPHDAMAYHRLLAVDGTHVLIGLAGELGTLKAIA